jgi:oligoendopeptidase F
MFPQILCSSTLATSAAPGDASIGALPEWNLADLYPALDAPEVARDLERGAAECEAFEVDYKGKVVAMASAADAGRRLAEAV